MLRIVCVAIALLAPAGPIAVLGLIGYDAISTAAGMQAPIQGDRPEGIDQETAGKNDGMM